MAHQHRTARRHGRGGGSLADGLGLLLLLDGPDDGAVVAGAGQQGGEVDFEVAHGGELVDLREALLQEGQVAGAVVDAGARGLHHLEHLARHGAVELQPDFRRFLAQPRLRQQRAQLVVAPARHVRHDRQRAREHRAQCQGDGVDTGERGCELWDQLLRWARKQCRGLAADRDPAVLLQQGDCDVEIPHEFPDAQVS